MQSSGDRGDQPFYFIATRNEIPDLQRLLPHRFFIKIAMKVPEKLIGVPHPRQHLVRRTQKYVHQRLQIDQDFWNKGRGVFALLRAHSKFRTYFDPNLPPSRRPHNAAEVKGEVASLGLEFEAGTIKSPEVLIERFKFTFARLRELTSDGLQQHRMDEMLEYATRLTTDNKYYLKQIKSYRQGVMLAAKEAKSPIKVEFDAKVEPRLGKRDQVEGEDDEGVPVRARHPTPYRIPVYSEADRKKVIDKVKGLSGDDLATVCEAGNFMALLEKEGQFFDDLPNDQFHILVTALKDLLIQRKQNRGLKRVKQTGRSPKTPKKPKEGPGVDGGLEADGDQAYDPREERRKRTPVRRKKAERDEIFFDEESPKSAADQPADQKSLSSFYDDLSDRDDF